MKNFLTLLDTIKTHDGNTIIYRTDHILKFFLKTYEENYTNLTPEEKQEGFILDQKYGDILIKMWKDPLNKLMNPNSDGKIEYILQNEDRNPIEEYEHALSKPKDDYMTEEEHNLKLERLRLHKEWFESQNN